jgi:hypothetical protein
MRPSTDRTAAAVQFLSRAVCMPSDVIRRWLGPGYGPVCSAATRCAEVMPSMIAATSSVTNAARASRASCSSTCFVAAGLVACIARAGRPCLI